MGMLDLPRGTFELYLKPKTAEANESKWTPVAFTDSISKGEIAECVEDWSINYEVLSARYNGREVTIPKKYHWELQSKGECFGSFKTRKEAQDELKKRRIQYRKDKITRPGEIVFVDYVQVRSAD